jgi:deazaflavin-dependent oxidoreductase (nitroreductase family)
VIPPIHRFILRMTGGRTMLDTAAQPMMMLTTTGAKSGLQRETPLATIPRPDGTYLVVGSNFARESHPAWTGNLLAHPEATVTFHGRTEQVTARLLDGDERAQRWSEALEWYPGWKDYTEVTDRPFRLFLLTPAAGPSAN